MQQSRNDNIRLYVRYYKETGTGKQRQGVIAYD
nr:MAG TPA: hypothetical protein [Caudoviricetes sp.]